MIDHTSIISSVSRPGTLRTSSVDRCRGKVRRYRRNLIPSHAQSGYCVARDDWTVSYTKYTGVLRTVSQVITCENSVNYKIAIAVYYGVSFAWSRMVHSTFTRESTLCVKQFVSIELKIRILGGGGLSVGMKVLGRMRHR
jgi:hypothetical protein